MALCDEIITQDIQNDCDNPIVGGIEPNGVIINRQDIDYDNVVFDDTRKNVIKALPLKAGARGYKVYIPGSTPFAGTKATMEKGTNRNTFTNDLAMIVMNNDPDVCAKIIDAIANGSFVVIYENKFKNINKATNPGDSAFQIVGYYQGAKAETLENDKYSEDTEGGWSVLLQETKSPKSGLFLFDTDIATTRELIESLTETP